MINLQQWMDLTDEQRQHRSLVSLIEKYIELYREELHEMDDEELYELERQIALCKASQS